MPTSEFPPLTHVAVTVRDLSASFPWYEALFDAKPVLPRGKGTWLGLVHVDGYTYGVSCPHWLVRRAQRRRNRGDCNEDPLFKAPYSLGWARCPGRGSYAFRLSRSEHAPAADHERSIRSGNCA